MKAKKLPLHKLHYTAALSPYVMEVMVQKSNASYRLTLKNMFTPEPLLSRNHLFMPQRLFSIRISSEPRVSQSIYIKKNGCDINL